MIRSNPDRFGELLFYGIVLLVAYLAFSVIAPFLAPLAWAAIFALTLNPLYRRLLPRLGSFGAALATTITAAVVIVGPLATLMSMLSSEIPRVVEFLQTLPQTATPERVQTVWNLIRARVPVALPDDPTRLLSQAAQTVFAFLAPQLGSVLANIASTIGSLFVMLFALFFLLRDGDAIADVVRRILPFREESRERLITDTRDLVIASVGAGLAVSAVQGFIGGLTFWSLGAGAPVAWGVAIGIASLIPVVGASLVWGPVAIWWLLSGDMLRGVALIIVCGFVVGLVDNVLRPLLLSGRTSVNGLVVFLGLLGGVGVFGFVGLVVGPIVLVIASTLLEALTRRPEDDREAVTAME
jgi:predicted PurR-regulated permease PerM